MSDPARVASERQWPDRFVIGVVVGVLVLVAAGILTVLLLPTAQTYVDDATPAGVVHNYYVALEQGDLRRAYDYLAPSLQARVSYDRFAAEGGGGLGPPGRRARVVIDEVREEGDTARVVVMLTYPQEGWLFFGGGSYSLQENLVLRRGPEGWRISDGPFYFREPWPLD